MNWIQDNPGFLRRFPPGRRYLIGVSGGRDSVALLHQLVEAGYDKLIVCHLNHHLRGRLSDADARFVRKLAESLDLEVRVGSENVRDLALRKKLSNETAGREARYAFFAKVAGQRRCHTIFLAHHADDLVETFLINLCRGAGLTGLAAMREVATRRVSRVDLAIVRPLIGIWRTQIDAYVKQQRLKFREDASNKSLAPLRNRVRRKIIPYLEKNFGRSIRRSIWRTATILADEEAWIESQLPESNATLPVEKLRSLPKAIQRRQILKWLRTHQVTDIGFDLTERVRSLLDPSATVAKVNLPKGKHVRRREKKIFIEN